VQCSMPVISDTWEEEVGGSSTRQVWAKVGDPVSKTN
jgi:hypothetical protein